MLRFIAEYVESLDFLEVLFLLRRTPLGWSAGATASELRLDGAATAACLERLVQQGFARRNEDGTYLYQPVAPALDAGVVALQAAYAERRVAVITAIFSRPHDRVQLFADAFRLRRDKK